jgi:cytochrome c-type biogenesis protein CcmH/NrfG
MRYWKGLVIAAGIDLVSIMVRPLPTAPATVAPFDAIVEWPEQAPVEAHTVAELMAFLQDHPTDVDAMGQLADFYAQNGWWDGALNPLARALQLDPSRRSLWSALDRAVERSGKEKITDAELTRRALEFVESVETWGHSC